jgi:hypothetical protein
MGAAGLRHPTALSEDASDQVDDEKNQDDDDEDADDGQGPVLWIEVSTWFPTPREGKLTRPGQPGLSPSPSTPDASPSPSPSPK